MDTDGFYVKLVCGIYCHELSVPGSNCWQNTSVQVNYRCNCNTSDLQSYKWQRVQPHLRVHRLEWVN